MSTNPDLAIADDGDIAIIALQCRFAGAADVTEYWHLLTEGRYGATQLDDLTPAPGLVRREAAVAGIELFDAGFFGYLPADASLIDPQQRVFLECAYHVFEQAGYDPGRYPGLVGVYAGAGQQDYYISNVLPTLGVEPSSLAAGPAAFANAVSSLPTRVSYHLNLTGPSIAVQTACSTSLAAVHLACQELLDHRCDLALAGGVSLNPDPGQGYQHVPGGPLSPDGHCRTFDAAAAGMFPGDGVGIVLLKRLADALADGDRVRAVIKGSALNNDGHQKAGFTAPSVAGQAGVIVAAHAVAGVDPATIGMIEAHGTATPVGDPIEMAALTKAFHGAARTSPCLLGSAKPNIGHTDAAAGVAGLIKAVLAIEYATVPASLDYSTPNPLLDLANSPFEIPVETTAWPAGDGPRRAGVSAFGIGGTNVHVVLEQAPPATAPAAAPETESLLVLSAATSTALDQQAAQLAAFLRRESGTDLSAAAATLQLGRRPLQYRRSVVSGSAAQASAALAGPGEATRAHDSGAPVVLLLPGGGAQYPSMGVGLYRTETVYRETINQCARIMAQHCDIDLRDHLYGGGTSGDDRLDLIFPAVLATEYALAAQLACWGVRPHAMLGHSLGEYAAACLAGVLDIEQALPLVSARGRLFTRAGGATTSVLLSAAEVEPVLGGRLAISGIIGANACTVSGPTTEIVDLERQLELRGAQFQRVLVPVAVHSAELDPVLDELATLLAGVTLRPPTVPYLSNVTGTWVRPEDATDPAYWVRHSREPVQLQAGLAELRSLPGAVLLETGPGRALTRLAQLHNAVQPGGGGNDDPPLTAIATMRHRDEDSSDRHALLRAVGKAWEHGADIDWAAVSPVRRSRIELPCYPFERQRYWISRPEQERAAPSRVEGAALPVWRGRPPVQCTPKPLGRWLILTDGSAVRRELALAVAGLAGQAADIAGPGEVFAPVEYEHIVVLPGVADVESSRARYTEVARRVAAAGAAVTVHLCVHNAFDVTGAEHVDPGQWLAVGAADWMRANTSPAQLNVIDLDQLDPGLLATELAVPGAGRTVALRNGHRWELDSEPVAGADARWSGAGEWLRTQPDPRPAASGPEPVSAALDSLCAQYASNYLRGNGIDLTIGSEFTRAEVIGQLGVIPAYHKVVDVLLRVLSEDGIVSVANGRVRVGAPAPAPPDLARWCADNPALAAQAALLDTCVRGYDSVLRGQIAGNEVVMPGGDDSAQRIINEQRIANSDFAVHHELVAGLLARLAATASPARPLRILEIGAGRGYLTWPVAEALRAAAAGSVEYYFTDIGRSFVVAGQQRAAAAGLDFMRFATFDVAKDPATSALPPGGFDVVLAFNVLHVAPDLRACIKHVADVTAPGGVLLLLEGTHASRWDLMIDSLLTGWLDYADELRTDSPLLEASRWMELLDAGGFAGSTIHAEAAGHALIVAGRAQPVRVLDAEFGQALATVRDIAALPPSGQRAVLTGPSSGSLDAALAAGFARGLLTARHRAGMRDWTFADTSAAGSGAAAGDLLAQVIAGPAAPAVVLAGPAAVDTDAGAPPGPQAPTPPAESAFNKRPQLATPYCPPRSGLEEKIAAIWQRFFGYDRIGVHDKFLELGGESLLAMQITGEQRSALGIETTMGQLLQSGTVAGVAAAAASSAAQTATTAAPRASRGRPAQRTADGVIVTDNTRAPA